MLQRSRSFALHAAVLALLVPAVAWAQPDFSGSVVINEDDGFPGVCDEPCFSVEKVFEVFLDGNATGPGVCAAGENTFLYTLTHLGGSGSSGGFVPDITDFAIMVDFPLVASAGFLPGAGVDPSSTTIDPAGAVRWEFHSPPIPEGSSSDTLFICSAAPPGMEDDNTVSATGGFVLDAPGKCIGPIEAACQLEIDKTCCLPRPPSPGVDQCNGKVVRMKFEHLNQDCSATTNQQSGKAKCSGGAPGTPVDVVITKDSDKIFALPSMNVPVGGTFQIFTTEDKLPSATKFRLDGGLDSQDLEIHTSCSKPLSCGDVFGSVRLVELETTEGGIVNCETPPGDATACVPTPAPTSSVCDESGNKLSEIVFEYVGADCQDPLANPQGGEAECDGDATGATDVSFIYTGKDADKITVSPASNVNDGDLVRVTATGQDRIANQTKLLIQDAGGQLQKIHVHTSCSQALDCGDVFGSLTVVGFTQEGGQPLSCEPPSTPDIFQDACSAPIAPPAPHCTSKIMDLQLVYIGDFLGEGCTVSNSQEGKASCTGVDDPGDPVSVTITKDPDKVFADPDTSIAFGDVISIFKEEGGVIKELGSTTEFDVTGAGGTQSLEIHTSCSKPLNLGDRFGSFVVFGIDRKDDGFVGLGAVVEYQYKVTNPNASPVVNVQVTDDQVMGAIVSGESLAAGEMKTFFSTRSLLGSTTNQAMVSGELQSGGSCEAAEDTAFVEVTVPPQGPFDCSDAKPIDELTMIWDGMQSICVQAYDGDVGGTLLKTVDNVVPGQTISVPGIGGSPNDQQWQIFAADDCGGTPLGVSEFHVSCSDDDMNGVEDCGKNQGNGKGNDAGLVNDWLLEGMSGDQTLECTPGANALPPVICGLGPELALLLPGLWWLHRRRQRRAA